MQMPFSCTQNVFAHPPLKESVLILLLCPLFKVLNNMQVLLYFYSMCISWKTSQGMNQNNNYQHSEYWIYLAIQKSQPDLEEMEMLMLRPLDAFSFCQLQKMSGAQVRRRLLHIASQRYSHLTNIDRRYHLSCVTLIYFYYPFISALRRGIFL